jgi:hypothetical protein
VEKIRPAVTQALLETNPSGECRLNNMSVPPRTNFESVVRLVTGQFSLFQIKPPKIKLTKSQLARSVFALGLQDIPPLEEVEKASLALPAFLIGVQVVEGIGKSCHLADAASTIAILSRRVGEIYVRSRQPDYSAQHIFSQRPFTVESWEAGT